MLIDDVVAVDEVEASESVRVMAGVIGATGLFIIAAEAADGTGTEAPARPILLPIRG